MKKQRHDNRPPAVHPTPKSGESDPPWDEPPAKAVEKQAEAVAIPSRYVTVAVDAHRGPVIGVVKNRAAGLGLRYMGDQMLMFGSVVMTFERENDLISDEEILKALAL